jgi:hypothetical protein
MPEEQKPEFEEELVQVENDDRIKLSDVLSAILEFNADPHNEEKYDRVQELMNSIVVRERLTLMEKDVALVAVLNRIPEEAKNDAATAAVTLELAKYFDALLKYAVNLKIDVPYSALDIAVYDALEAFGFGDYMRRFCEKDYAKLCGMIDNSLDFRNIDKIVRIAALFSDENMKEFKETVAALKTELTPERLAQMKALVAAGDPAWEALRGTMMESAVENAMMQDTQTLNEEPAPETPKGGK